jgi:precorrin-6Y C5,15-methyltransferase (decarboxylating)
MTVVGIGDDGCASLTSRAVNAVMNAGVLVGGERHLACFPDFHGEKIVVKNGLLAILDRLADLTEEQTVCVLASGDPLFFGIGSLVIDRLGAEQVEILPQPSSMQWAFARAGLRWDDAKWMSLHGRSADGFLTRLKRQAKVAIFTDQKNSPSELARRMVEAGETGWKAWVCENLAGPGERVRCFEITDLAYAQDIGPLNVLLLVRSDPSWRPPATVPFLHDDVFAKRMPKKGLITKREVRLMSLAAMQIRPDSVVWDIGAGSGSVSIEAAMLASDGRVYAVEVDPEGIEICRENLRFHAVDNVRVIAGRAPEALEGLEAPDAVFIGGSKGQMEQIVEVVMDRLQPGGRLVVNAITLENVSETYQALRRRGVVPDVTLLQVSRAAPLAQYLRYESLNPIQMFVVEKPRGA